MDIMAESAASTRASTFSVCTESSRNLLILKGYGGSTLEQRLPKNRSPINTHTPLLRPTRFLTDIRHDDTKIQRPLEEIGRTSAPIPATLVHIHRGNLIGPNTLADYQEGVINHVLEIVRS